MSDISKNIRLRLERLLPAVMRMKTYEASEIFQGPIKRMIGPAGLSSQYAGTMVAYYYVDADEYLEHGNVYYTKIRSNDGTGWSEWITSSMMARADYPNWVDFVFNPESAGSYHFQLEVYSDEDMETLEFSADSSVDQLGWYHVDTSILEKLLYPLGMEAEVTEAEIKALERLLDIDVASPMLLQYMAMTLGSMINENDPIEYSRWLVRNIVDVWRMKGTRHSWRFGWIKKHGADRTVKELYKMQPNEVGDYNWYEDELHDIRAARVNIGSCESTCETLQEFTPWDYETQVAALREVEEYRPIHVLIPIDINTVQLSETIDPYEETFDNSIFVDWQEDMEFDEEILINVQCIINCETACQSCCEITCEFSACELNCQTGCEGSCQNTCEGACQAGCQVGCQAGCEANCQQACEAFCEWPCENACQIFERENLPDDLPPSCELMAVELVERNPDLWCPLAGGCQGGSPIPLEDWAWTANQGGGFAQPLYYGNPYSDAGDVHWSNPDAGDYVFGVVPCGRAYPSFSIYQDSCDDTFMYWGDGLAPPDCWMYRSGSQTLKLYNNLEIDGALYVNGGGDLEARVAALEALVGSYPVDLPSFPNDLALVTDAEAQQIANIGANTINNTQWGKVVTMQDVSTTASPDFDAVTIASDYGINSSGIVTAAQVDGYDSGTSTTYTGYNGSCGDITDFYNGVPYG